MAQPSPDDIQLIFLADRRTAEALSLEVRRLAKSLGLEVGEIRVELAAEPEEEQKRGSG